MSIIYDEKQRTITLHTDHTTYQMQIDRYGFLLHLYYGGKADGCMDYLLTYYDRGFSGNPYEAGTDKTYSMDSLPQEFPSLGTGDYRTPACIIKNTDRTYCSDFRYVSHEIRDGKYALPGLPAVYADTAEAQTAGGGPGRSGDRRARRAALRRAAPVRHHHKEREDRQCQPGVCFREEAGPGLPGPSGRGV